MTADASEIKHNIRQRGYFTMSLSVQQKAEIIKEYQLTPGDTGSVEVQVAVLTADIKSLTEHLKHTSMITTHVVVCCVK